LPFASPPAPVADDDDEWDEAPRILSLPTSLPPRPAIFRDLSPASATAEPLGEEPAPAPAPAQQLAPAAMQPPPQPVQPDATPGPGRAAQRVHARRQAGRGVID